MTSAACGPKSGGDCKENQNRAKQLLRAVFSCYFLEIAQGLIDGGNVGKGVGELGEDFLEPDDLMAVDHADQHGPGSLGVHALALEHRDACLLYTSECHTLETQCGGTTGNHVGIIPEEGYQFRGKDEAQNADD